MHESFEGLQYNDPYFTRKIPGVTGIILRGLVTNATTTVQIGGIGPRGGWHPLGMGGTHNNLQLQAHCLSEARLFERDLDERRRRWIAAIGQ